jgi:hypothetical protein
MDKFETSLMSTFRVHLSALETRISPLELLNRLMRELRGAGGIVPAVAGSTTRDVPRKVTFIFINQEYEASSDFRKHLQGLIEKEVRHPVNLSIEKKDEVTGSWILG